MRGISNRRRCVAYIACLAWLLGIVGLPALHLTHHDADHTHDTSGAIVAHSHDHAKHEAKAPAGHRDLGQLAIDHPVEIGHQAGGVAHYAVALLEAELPAIVPPHDRPARQIAWQPIVRTDETHLARPIARGPPRA